VRWGALTLIIRVILRNTYLAVHPRIVLTAILRAVRFDFSTAGATGLEAEALLISSTSVPDVSVERLVQQMKNLCAILVISALILAAKARADEPKPIQRPYGNGELVKLTIEGRRAFLIRPTQVMEPARHWIWVTPAYLALPDDHGVVEHRMYTDFRSWPGLDKALAYPEPALRFGLSLEELTRRAAEFNPIDNLAPLARAGVKIFHIHGDKDVVVPCDANSQTVIEKYHRLGGDARLEIIPGFGHGGKPFYNSESLAKFLIE
jgi:pimeloyl-ACP methyl ester carboxylesterase